MVYLTDPSVNVSPDDKRKRMLKDVQHRGEAFVRKPHSNYLEIAT